MIPAYKEDVKITIQEKSADSLEDQVRQLQEQVRILRETVDYMNRERTRMKSELDSIRHVLSK
jgi:predicted RNase H-like nuclease (RuvC/YqgF family)